MENKLKVYGLRLRSKGKRAGRFGSETNQGMKRRNGRKVLGSDLAAEGYKRSGQGYPTIVGNFRNT